MIPRNRTWHVRNLHSNQYHGKRRSKQSVAGWLMRRRARCRLVSLRNCWSVSQCTWRQTHIMLGGHNSGTHEVTEVSAVPDNLFFPSQLNHQRPPNSKREADNFIQNHSFPSDYLLGLRLACGGLRHQRLESSATASRK
jgi:hypothetical protein